MIEIYEDNAGGLYLCVLEQDGKCKRIFGNWEYCGAGILKEALEELAQDEFAFNCWDGDLSLELDKDVEELYDEISSLNELIYDGDFYYDRMGAAAKIAFAIEDE